jgi:hypothetical protein
MNEALRRRRPKADATQPAPHVQDINQTIIKHLTDRRVNF